MTEDAVIGWTKGTGFAVHTYPGCPVAQRTKHVTPEILDLMGHTIAQHACKACRSRGWSPAKESTIEEAALAMGDRLSDANYSEGAASRMYQGYRAALTRDLGKFRQPPTSILASQVNGSRPSAADRAAAILGADLDLSDVEAVRVARRLALAEIRSHRAILSEQASRLDHDRLQAFEIVLARTKRLLGHVHNLELLLPEIKTEPSRG